MARAFLPHPLELLLPGSHVGLVAGGDSVEGVWPTGDIRSTSPKAFAAWMQAIADGCLHSSDASR